MEMRGSEVVLSTDEAAMKQNADLAAPGLAAPDSSLTGREHATFTSWPRREDETEV